MIARALVPLIALSLVAAKSGRVVAPAAFWPPWISIESPTNPFDASTRDALFLVHAMMRAQVPQLSDLTASAEGLVSGARRTITVRLDATSQPGVFAVRRQWPVDGTWLVCVTLEHTTALIAFDREGRVAQVRVPTQSADRRLPRAVSMTDIDSALVALAAASQSLADR